MASSHALGVLNLQNVETAKTWLLAFGALARAKKWTDEGETRGITDNFMALCGLDALKKVQYIVAPKNILQMKFEDVQRDIEAYLPPRAKLTIAEKTRFYVTRHFEDEAVADFVLRLRKEAASCEFEKLKESADPTEEMIRVAMVAGLHNSSIKEKVLEKLQTAELTVAQIQEFVKQCEQTRQFVRQDETIDAATKSKSLDEINYNKSIRTIRENQISDCRYCGRSHAIRKCPAFGKQCTKCLKHNHFANVYKSVVNRDTPKRIYATTDNKGSSSEDDILFVGASCNVNSVNDTLMTVYINSKQISMQKDTGADVSLISSKIWKFLGEPALKKSTKRLEAYDGHVMTCLGSFMALLENADKFHTIELVVVPSKKCFGLLGRDILSALDTGIHQVSCSVKEPINEALPAIKGVRSGYTQVLAKKLEYFGKML